MLSTTDIARVYETILSIPGMIEPVKIDMKLSRKNVLLLHAVIKRGLALPDDEASKRMLEGIPPDTLKELEEFAESCLSKAGLTELNHKLQALSLK